MSSKLQILFATILCQFYIILVRFHYSTILKREAYKLAVQPGNLDIIRAAEVSEKKNGNRCASAPRYAPYYDERVCVCCMLRYALCTCASVRNCARNKFPFAIRPMEFELIMTRRVVPRYLARKRRNHRICASSFPSTKNIEYTPRLLC